jgi:hypothetical protein
VALWIAGGTFMSLDMTWVATASMLLFSCRAFKFSLSRIFPKHKLGCGFQPPLLMLAEKSGLAATPMTLATPMMAGTVMLPPIDAMTI